MRRNAKMLSILVSLVCCAAFAGIQAVRPADSAQEIQPELLSDRWSASWIMPAGAPPFDYGVYHFRRTFDLDAKPSSFVIHVTGDNRYQL